MGCSCLRSEEEYKVGNKKYLTLNEIYIPTEKLKKRQSSPFKSINNESRINESDSSISNLNYRRIHQSLKDTSNLGSFKFYCEDNLNDETNVDNKINSNILTKSSTIKHENSNNYDNENSQQLDINNEKLVFRSKNDKIKDNDFNDSNSNIEELNYTTNIIKEKQTRNLNRKTTAIISKPIISENLPDLNNIQRHNTQQNLNFNNIDEEVIFISKLNLL